MKKILIVSVLLVQGLWAAAAADGPKRNSSKPPTLKDLALQRLLEDQSFYFRPVSVIREILESSVYSSPERALADIYSAWLNLNPEAPIIIVQTARSACWRIGIGTGAFPIEWSRLTIDISPYVGPDTPIKNLRLRRGTIANAFSGKGLVIQPNGSLDLRKKKLTICDLWNNLPDEKKPTIKRIVLDGNYLTKLTRDSFAGLYSLVALSVEENYLTQLPSNIFTGLALLQTIYLSKNNLRQLPSNIFTGLRFLQRIYLNGNYLEQLAPHTFAGLPHLTDLWLSGNPELQLNNPDNLEALKTERPEWFGLPVGVTN